MARPTSPRLGRVAAVLVDEKEVGLADYQSSVKRTLA
jgi:hypothetical protein